MEDARKAKNRGSAQKSRDGERQRLGEDEYKRRRADAEKVRRKKMKEEEEIAAVADPALDHLAETIIIMVDAVALSVKHSTTSAEALIS